MRTHVRLLGIGVLTLAGALVAHWSKWPQLHASAPHDVMLLYVGADDCAPCGAWQMAAGTSFRASAEFARIIYHEVKAPTLRNILNDAYWPDELRPYRDQLGSRAGVPLWLVIADNDIVERGFGIGQWQQAVLPRLRALLRGMSRRDLKFSAIERLAEGHALVDRRA